MFRFIEISENRLLKKSWDATLKRGKNILQGKTATESGTESSRRPNFFSCDNLSSQ